MPLSLARLVVAGAVFSVSGAAAHAQDRDRYTERDRGGRRVDCDSQREERDRAEQRAREVRERALERARETRERALEHARDTRRELERQRAVERERALDRARERRDQERRDRERRHWRDDTRTTFGLGGGADIRRFDDVNRYVGVASVDFHSRSGIGIRPEVVYGWTDRQPASSTLYLASCATCSAVLPLGYPSNAPSLSQRSQMLGVTLNATYAFLRRSAVRPYVLGGIGVVSTREPQGQLVTLAPGSGPLPIPQVVYESGRRDRVDFALNAGSGLELGHGVLRPYVELRYLLTDTQTSRGFSGALPITVGVRF